MGASVNVALIDNDYTVLFDPDTYSAAEGGADVVVTVSLNRTPADEVIVTVDASAESTAVSGEDYRAEDLPVLLTFNPTDEGAGSLRRTFTVMVIDDSDEEGEETVVLGINTPPLGVTAGTATVTIEGNDTQSVLVSPDQLVVPEGGSSTYTVRLAADPMGEVVTVRVFSGLLVVDIDPQSLTFSSSDWMIEKSVVVEGVDDSDSNDEVTTIETFAAEWFVFRGCKCNDYGQRCCASGAVSVGQCDCG